MGNNASKGAGQTKETNSKLEPAQQEQIEQLAQWMAGKTTILVGGAGMSTDAGIPDYRGKGNTEVPSVDYDQFVSDPVWQRWVWLRNQQTWQTVRALEPTDGHRAVARLQKAGLINAVATQNVDGLDMKAGCDPVYELHGSFARVECVSCGNISSRESLHQRLDSANPHLEYDLDPAHVAILATADRAAAEACEFVTLPCEICGGLLKPAVVFFGQMLPEDAMSASYQAAREADVVLVVGSSLAVLTGLYVAHEAFSRGARLAVINRGPTAVDRQADLRIEGGSSQGLTALADLLLA